MMDEEEFFEHDPWLNYEVDTEDKQPIRRKERENRRRREKERTLRRKKERQRKYNR